MIELEYELIPEAIEPSFDGGVCNDYSYQSDNLDGTREEGYFESTDDYSTTGKGTDFDINTDPEDIISEMEENKKDNGGYESEGSPLIGLIRERFQQAETSKVYDEKRWL